MRILEVRLAIFTYSLYKRLNNWIFTFRFTSKIISHPVPSLLDTKTEDSFQDTLYRAILTMNICNTSLLITFPIYLGNISPAASIADGYLLYALYVSTPRDPDALKMDNLWTRHSRFFYLVMPLLSVRQFNAK